MLPVKIQRKIIDAHRLRKRENEGKPDLPHHFVLLGDSRSHPSYFIKFQQLGLLGEFRTLEYLRNLAESNPRAPRIPGAVDYFSNLEEPWGTHYLVMEYIPSPAVTLKEWIKAIESPEERRRRINIAVSKVADAISWLLSCSLPENASVGPVGGGTIKHRLWKEDCRAPLDFTSVAALERYINKALALHMDPHIHGPPPVISFANQHLQFCHSDITYDNFLIHPSTLELSMIDVDSITILPSPFIPYALTRNPFSKAVLEYLDFGYSPEVDLLRLASGNITIITYKRLGLDEDGYPVVTASLSRKLTFTYTPKFIGPIDSSNIGIEEVPIDWSSNEDIWPKLIYYDYESDSS
ncbi:hypothetical protein H0H92_008793 [Tricholoma furcatifolium]|nr:hypothetical protein H0H92_008793 [Tricholoma furcatifolium]